MAPLDEKVRARERITVRFNKMIPIIVCSLTAVAGVTSIDSGGKFNARHYVNKMLTPLSE
jgi:hypothetical protein